MSLSSGGSKFRRKADTYNSSVDELLEAYRDVPVAQGNKDIQQIFIQLNKASDDQVMRSIERVEVVARLSSRMQLRNL